MKRLSNRTTKILSLSLVMIMLAVMLPLATMVLPTSQPAYAACTPQTTVYTFSSGGGTNKWCWEGHVHSTDWPAHPSSPSDFSSSYGYVAGGSSAYTAVSSSNNAWWKSDISHDVGCCVNDRNGELFKFKINEVPAAISSIQVKWEGHGTTGLTTYYTTEKLWKNSTSTWNQLHNQQNIVSDTTWSDTISSSCSDYIDSSGYLYVFVASERSGISSSCGIWTDYIEVTVTYVPSYTLTYNAGTGGSITGSSPQTVNCGASGSTVTASPAACYHFVSWSDGVLTASRTDTNVNANITVQANFAINTYTLTYNAGTGGSITGSSPQTVNCGASGSTVTASPAACYRFVSWSDGVLTASRTDTNVNANITVQANFATDTYILTYTAGTGGSVTGSSPQTVNCGASGSAVTASPATYYYFINWSDGVLTPSRTDTNVHANITVQANFAINTYTLTTSAGSGGTVTAPAGSPHTYVNGTVVNIVATPNSCYSFNNWSGDTGTVANVIAKSTTITMNGNYSIQATFAMNTSVLSVTANNSGGVPDFSGTSPFNCGVNVSIYAHTAPGYVFAGWDPTDGIANASAENTTVLMSQSRSLTAYFASNLMPTPTPSLTPTPTPTSAPNNTTTSFLTWHITGDNFSLAKTSNYIVANILAGVSTGMGKYVQKQLTIYIPQRPSAMWGQVPVYAASGLRISGVLNEISGDVKVNGTVKVDSSASKNVIDGSLKCNSTDPNPIDQSKLSYTKLITPCPGDPIPSMGEPQTLFRTDLSAGIQVLNDSIHEYVFPANVRLHDVDQVWQNNDPEFNHTLKTGKYYCNGTITLSDIHTRGTVTFIADAIQIENNGGSSYEDRIFLLPYYEGLLLWAAGNKGTLTSADNGDILIKGTSTTNHPSVTLQGVLYAPNGEIELTEGGVMNNVGTDVIYRAVIDKGALISKYLTISGNYWYVYRW